MEREQRHTEEDEVENFPELMRNTNSPGLRKPTTSQARCIKKTADSGLKTTVSMESNNDVGEPTSQSHGLELRTHRGTTFKALRESSSPEMRCSPNRNIF